MKRWIVLLMAGLMMCLSFASAEEPELIEDPDNGRWEYRSENLQITIEKITETVKIKKQKRIRGVLSSM